MMFSSDIPNGVGNVPPTTVGDDADYTNFTVAANGDWVLGSTIKGQTLFVTVLTGALGAGTAGVRVVLREGANANGGTPSTVANSATTWEPSDTADITNATLRTTIDCALIADPTKYYSLGISVKGNGSGTLLCSASNVVLNPSYV